MLGLPETVFAAFRKQVTESKDEYLNAAMQDFWSKKKEYTDMFLNEYADWNRYYDDEARSFKCGINDILDNFFQLLNDLKQRLIKQGRGITEVHSRVLKKIFELVKKRKSFQIFLKQESSDKVTQTMLKDSNYLSIEARIENNDLIDVIDSARKAMARVSMGFTGNQNITKDEDVFDALDYSSKNKLICELVESIERAFIFKWKLNKDIYLNKQFLIENIFKHSFICDYIKKFILERKELKKSVPVICDNFVKEFFGFITRSHAITDDNLKEFNKSFLPEYMLDFKNVVKTYFIPGKPTSSKRKLAEAQGTSNDSSKLDNTDYSIDATGAIKAVIRNKNDDVVASSSQTAVNDDKIESSLVSYPATKMAVENNDKNTDPVSGDNPLSEEQEASISNIVSSTSIETNIEKDNENISKNESSQANRSEVKSADDLDQINKKDISTMSGEKTCSGEQAENKPDIADSALNINIV